MTNEQIKMIALSSAVAAAAGAVASAIVSAAISKASEERAQQNAEASVWAILGEQQTATSGMGAAALAVPLRSLVSSATVYAAWVEGRLQASLRRIAVAVANNPMSADERQQIGYDVAFSAKTIRARLAKVAADNQVTSVERQEMWMLASAIQTDLKRLHGNIDSWWMI